MAIDQDRSATADVEARVDSGEHGGLDSKFLASASLPERDETEISTGPDGSPLAAQPDTPLLSKLFHERLDLVPRQGRDDLLQFRHRAALITTVTNVAKQQLLVLRSIQPAPTRVGRALAYGGREPAAKQILRPAPAPHGFHNPKLDEARKSLRQLVRHDLTSLQPVEDQEIAGVEARQRLLADPLEEGQKRRVRDLTAQCQADRVRSRAREIRQRLALTNRPLEHQVHPLP